MAERSPQTPPDPTAQQREIAVANYTRALQVLQNKDHAFAVELLKTCCKIDPKNFLYRRELRKAQKERYGNNLKGSSMGWLSVPRARSRMKTAKQKGDYLGALEQGEEALTRNPWDLPTTMMMAECFDALGLLDLAVFSLDQARQKFKKNSTLNRALARLFEKKKMFKEAIALWTVVANANPKDVEANSKAKNLEAEQTIHKGGYEQVRDGTGGGPGAGSKHHQALSGSQGHTSLGDAAGDKLAAAAAPIQKRIEADPTEPSLYVQLAAIYRRAGADDRARAALQQGLKPTNNHFALQLELQELDLGKVQKELSAVETKLRALKAKPKGEDDADDDGPGSAEELTKTRGRLLRDVVTREVEIYKVRADKFPAEVQHRLELGLRLLKLDKLDEAIEALQQAKRDEKLKGKAALGLGLSFKKKGKGGWKLAERSFEEALQALPVSDEGNRKETLFQFATGAADNGNLDRAVELGHELANLDYNYKNIGKLLGEWEQKVG